MNDFYAPPDPEAQDSSVTADRRPDRRSFLKKVAIIIGALLGLAVLAWLLTPKATRAPGGRFAGAGPMPVLTAAVKQGEMPINLIGLGAVTPLATVTVQSQISGQITKIFFKEGQTVKPGDPLFQIDPRPYEVALEQAQGALARDKALLANAKTDLTRYETLFAQDSIAEQTLATQKALVVQDEGTVKADQGQVDAAKLNLTYSHIVSPISGRVGLQQVNLGNYVTPAEPNGLVVIAQLQPIAVTFSLPEDQIPPLMKQLHGGNSLTVTAYDRTNTNKLATGTLQSIDSQIDATTGTLKMKAIFPNDEETLFPQQFVNVQLLLDTLHNALLIPQAAVQRGAPGTYVYVVNPDQSVNVRTVTLGPGDPQNIVVSAGLKAGEIVVTDGADKLKDGAKVLVREAHASPGAAPSANHGPNGQGQGQHHRRQTGQGGPGAQGGQPQTQ
jgi:multidrug efflux system membrane fusion protein